MRKGFGIGLSVLGGFLVVAALLAQFWAPGQLKKTPLDTDSITYLEGTAELSDGDGGTNEFPVRAFSVTRADSERSDSDVVVFQNSSCLVKDEGGIDECVSANDPQERLISASHRRLRHRPRHRRGGQRPEYLPPSAEEKEGLVNKWPFDAEKKTYNYWDGTAGEAVDACTTAPRSVDGLETYVYHVSVEDAPVEVERGVHGIYSRTRTSGSTRSRARSSTRSTRGSASTTRATLPRPDSRSPTSRSRPTRRRQGQRQQLGLLSKTVPLIGYIVGIPPC